MIVGNMKKHFPNDATGDALRRFEQSNGFDISKPLEIEFFVVIPSKKMGNKVALKVSNLGFKTSVEKDGIDEAEYEWTCYCTKTLIPNYYEIVKIEEELDNIAKLYGGYIDGFGSFGNIG